MIKMYVYGGNGLAHLVLLITLISVFDLFGWMLCRNVPLLDKFPLLIILIKKTLGICLLDVKIFVM